MAPILLGQLLFLAIFGHALSDGSKTKPPETRAEAMYRERKTYGARMASYVDNSVDPCDDFYQYSCGNFFKVNKYKYGTETTSVFSVVSDELEDALHDILIQPSTSAEMTVSDKAKNFYQSCMRVDIFSFPKSEAYLKVIESMGGCPAFSANWTAENFDWFNMTSALASYGISGFISAIPGDEKFYIGPAVLGISTELENRPASKDYIVNKRIILKLLSMYGVPPRNAKKIFREIVQLAIEWKKFSKKYSITWYNEFNKTIDDLVEEIPTIDWSQYIYSIFGQEVNSSYNIFAISSKKYLQNLPNFFKPQYAKAAANYLALQFLFNLHDELNHAQYQKSFCITKVNNVMKDVVTAMYINSKYHLDVVEDEVMSMAAYMRSALKDIIKEIDWMDKETKRKALIKLRDMRMVIGDVELSLDFESLENDYKDLEIKPNSDYHENVLTITQYILRKEYKSYIEDNDGSYKPEKYEADVNAYYYPYENKMVLPAGILRKPFFNPELPKSYNFGAMGANILGHEMTHGFDSNGRNYDEDGDVENWWSNKSAEAFEERAECFVDQYNSFRIEEINEQVKGDRTLGENIADAGGVRQGFLAYKKWLKANEAHIDITKETLPKLNMTNTQLFFLAYAQSYCGMYKRKGFQMIAYDEHAVDKFRVIGSVSNSDQFAKEFNCKLGTTMNPVNKCVLW